VDDHLPIVTPQGLRVTHATASMRPHANPHEVAAALGHTSFRVTERHYAQPEAVAAAKQQAACETLLASKTRPKLRPKLLDTFPRQPREDADGQQKTPCFQGVPLCEEGDLNPHGC
jgi:hypothetical protein